jgi:hypothetical protein
MNHIFRFHIQFWHHSQQNPWKFLHRTPANSLNIYSYTIWKYINITRRDTLLLFSKKKHILLQIYAIAKHINGYATAWHIDCKTHCLCFQILSFYFCMFTVHIFTLLTLIFWIINSYSNFTLSTWKKITTQSSSLRRECEGHAWFIPVV